MTLNAPPSGTELLERGRDSAFTGKTGAVWVKWFSDAYQILASAVLAITGLSVAIASEAAARISNDALKADKTAISGTFTTVDGKTVTVVNGVITSIV